MNKVLMFTMAGLIGASTPLSAQSSPNRTIVEVAAEAGNFGTLLTAVRAAGLEEALRGAGPFTVFAPTDEAFAALPEGTLESLLANPDQLRAVLTYHVVAGRVTSAEVVNAGMAHPTTLQGSRLDVRVVDGKVRVDEATVVAADVGASNGVIHVIDRVVLPKGK
jgi:uncharacterized surface protein with fasciclin (FAS1) repeats